MAEGTCCKTCQKQDECRRGVCMLSFKDALRDKCYPCEAYEEVPVPASSKPRIVAV